MPPAFSTLADAVRFLVDCVDSDDSPRLHAACADPKGCAAPAFAALKHFHSVRELGEMYAGREFPEGENEFKLGGHGAELGHLHIDFARESGVFGRKSTWRLESLWICR